MPAVFSTTNGLGNQRSAIGNDACLAASCSSLATSLATSEEKLSEYKKIVYDKLEKIKRDLGSA